jgi:FtsP/CotA-like multicopper oxidase with cupredoxin domain
MNLEPPRTPGTRLHRRALLHAGAGGAGVLGSVALGAATLPLLGSSLPGVSGQAEAQSALPTANDHHGGHLDNPSMAVGEVDLERLGFDPTVVATDFDYGDVSTDTQGRTVREFALTAYDREIEIAPGLFFPAWTYNGRVPGPTLRANEGDLVRVHFTNAGSMPHSIHFHGIHSAYMDGVPGIGRGEVEIGGQFTYEFTAAPFGCHLYHCHAVPLKRHLHKGLYGAYIVNPDPAKHGERARARHPDFPEAAAWQEFVLVMNAFDTNFDAENEVYAVNSVAFHYMKHPLVIDRTRPVRVYLVNVTDFDLLNSFHLHANFFDYYDTGTNLEPTLRTIDTVSQVQAQRGILEFSFRDHEPGIYMFHAHVSEFADLGWMSAFDVR